jgi:hypothetical protein
VVGRDLVAVAVDLEPAGPRPELGQPAAVEEHPAVGVAVDVLGLLDRRHVAVPHQVVGDAVLGGVEGAAELLEPFDHLDLEGPDGGVHPVEAELARRPHHPVLVAPADEGEGVGDPEVGVLALSDDEEELVGARMAVEVVAVVEVAIAGADLADGGGHLVDREVVER